ncbi:hypothetical protein HOY80DRAFT_328524 [Tuber brumale]|nr:hypothetical protein HOY80DRAFT_328524 [Tuber brumale]
MRNFFCQSVREGGIMAFNFISQCFTNIQPTNTKLKLPLSLFLSPLPFSLILLPFLFFLLPTKFCLGRISWEGKVLFYFIFILTRSISSNYFFYSLCPFGQFICPFTRSIPYPPTQPPGARERSLEGFKRLLSRAAQAARRTASVPENPEPRIQNYHNLSAILYSLRTALLCLPKSSIIYSALAIFLSLVLHLISPPLNFHPPRPTPLSHSHNSPHPFPSSFLFCCFLLVPWPSPLSSPPPPPSPAVLVVLHSLAAVT